MRNYDLSNSLGFRRRTARVSQGDPLLGWASRAPEKALVIWSPGPDGMDDGGRIVYDPTNGTISGGDLVVFPEGY